MLVYKRSYLIYLFIVSLFIATPSSSAQSSLRDVTDSYAAEQIMTLNKAGIVLGDQSGLFHPEKPVTRGEFVTMLTRTLGLQPIVSELPAYRDVSKSMWAYGNVQAGVQLGLINGTSTNTFEPNRYINRQEVAVLLARAFFENPSSSSTPIVTDLALATDWTRPYIMKVVDAGLMNGYQGKFRPSAPLSRQEIAVVLERIYSNIRAVRADTKPLIQLGWQYSSNTTQFIEQVKRSTINTLSPRWFFLEADGRISDHTDASIITWAHQNDKQVWALVGNRFRAELTHQYLSNSKTREAIVTQLVEYANKYELDGLNIDFEGMNPEDKASFTSFISELAVALHKHHVLLSVDVPPDLSSTWSDPFDFHELGKSADYIVVMAYDEHWEGGPKAGPVSSLPWFTRSIEKMAGYVPTEKIIAGLPFYTRDWSQNKQKLTSRNLLLPESYSLIRTTGALLSWNPVTDQYMTSYQKAGVSHSIWMEDSRSLSAKVQSALSEEVGGLAFWYMGAESSDVWKSMQNAKTYQQIRERHIFNE